MWGSLRLAPIMISLYQSLFVISIISSVYCAKLDQTRSCPIWHIPIQDRNGHTKCVCGAKINGTITCEDDLLYVRQDYCLTWNNSTDSAEIHRCLLDHWDTNSVCIGPHQNSYHISTNISGVELNYLSCEKFDRQDSLCKHCIEGYGPAVFSNGISCADCSKHRHLWMLDVLFQLSMVTLLCLVIILLQIKGTASPFNAIITYAQMCAVALKISGGTHSRLICYFGHKTVIIFLTVIDVLNLDFFHAIIPPLCISPSTKAINSLLFNYLVAFYPLVFTAFIYISIELYDRNFKVILLISYPIRRCTKIFRTTGWDPRRTILNTFITFFLLSYSKLLFASINLLIASQSFNSRGELVPNTTVLLYDPSIRFFHSEHIPYAIFALVVIVVFILLPPLVLVLYPTRVFHHSLHILGFHRWDILHHIMNLFQGWYKDGTEGTRDYRSLSALYLLLRIGFCCLFVTALLQNDFGDRFLILLTIGVLHILLGAIFFTIKPHRKTWMSNADGIILTLFGVMSILANFSEHAYILGAIVIPGSVLILTVLYYTVRYCIKEHNVH